MDLKELLGEDLYNQLMQKLGDKAKIAIVSDGNWIPKEKFDEANNERKQYKQQVEDLNKKLGELQNVIKDNEEAAKTIDTLKKQIAEKEDELNNTRKMNAIKLEVLKANPNDVNDIIPHLKQDAINIADDGTVLGLEEQIKALKESKPYLFKEVDLNGTGGSVGNGPKDKTPPAVNNLADALKQYYQK
ncbi:phage scaffolding protein [Thermoanaerobacterium sp. CMT5567-10]|uniref:phage scaffolding protein n=1 Tax=Thermoanaerobacterium sp. CMT5567-10 TaxID=3061989 RepID=UPI0026E05B9F|nr:phage scaffolding protein [Thermoanaerobacterium sp. CMT5567-10]WKV08191.1 phage scaffolding protein [Thermoanaerobacterium sp. CMT5567-10]